MTTLDGTLLAAEGVPVSMRWLAHRVDRRVTFNAWGFETSTTIVPRKPAVIIRVMLRNMAERERTCDLRLRLSGRTRNTGGEGYMWSVPRVATTVELLNRPEGLDVVEQHEPAINAVRFHNKAEPCCSIQGIIGTRSTWENRRMVIQSRIGSGGSLEFVVLLVFGHDPAQARDLYNTLAANIDRAIESAEEHWMGQWGDASRAVSFGRPGQLSPSLQRLMDTSILTALYLRRDYPTRCDAPSLYLTLTPRRGEGSFYLWDIGMAAPFISRIDPQAVRAMVHLTAAGLDVYGQQMINAFTGKGGGWFYSFNFWSVFRMIWGVLSATRDLSWLDQPLAGIRHGQTVFDLLREMALAWTTCTPGQLPLVGRTGTPSQDTQGQGGGTDPGPPRLPYLRSDAAYPYRLPDFGDRGGHLEACTPYEHQTAAASAACVWMMRRLAEIHVYRGETSAAAELQSLSGGLAAEILRMYRPADGFFSCGKPDGTVFPSRVSLDHFMTMTCMAEDIPASVRNGLVASFQRELQTPAWMRCVSPHDPDVVSGFRCDTTWCGSYPGFVALMAEGLCKMNFTDLAIQWLERISAIAAQGPIGQAYWAESQRRPLYGGPLKATDELPHGTHWCEMGGVTFGSTIVHGVLARPWSPFET